MAATPVAGKVIAITGGGSGIGLATAQMLARRGALLSLADVNGPALEQAKADIEAAVNVDGYSVLTTVLDVRRYDDVERWVDATVARFGRLDGAANLAGVIPRSIGVHDLSEEDGDADWEFVIGVNLTGVRHCLKAQLGKIADGGAVVNASSVAGVLGRMKNSSYTASKHGVIGLTRSTAKEVGRRAVRVNAICPGTIETPMVFKARGTITTRQPGEDPSEQSHVALGRTGRPDEVAHLITYLLGDESTYISGQAISIDGGWHC